MSKRRSSRAMRPRSYPAGSRRSEISTASPASRERSASRTSASESPVGPSPRRRAANSSSESNCPRPRAGLQPSAMRSRMTATPTRSWLARPPRPRAASRAAAAQGGGQARRVAELAGLTEAHRRRAVEEEVQAQILLVHEELQIEAVEAAVDVPVDVAEVVPGAIGPVVGELDAHPRAETRALAGGATPKGPAREEREPLELEEELGREQVLTAGRGGHELSLVQRLEVLLHLPVIVARDLLAGDVLFHLLAVLPEHPEVLQPRGHLAAASDHVGVDAFLSPRTRFALDADVVRVGAETLGGIALGAAALALARQRALALGEVAVVTRPAPLPPVTAPAAAPLVLAPAAQAFAVASLLLHGAELVERALPGFHGAVGLALLERLHSLPEIPLVARIALTAE